MNPPLPVSSSSPASILAKISSRAPEEAISAATSAPRGRSSSSVTKSILFLSDGPITYTEDLTRPRYSLWKNPENLSDHQQIKLAWIAATDPRLYRAYLLKEGLRTIFAMPHPAAVEALDRWISWRAVAGSRRS